jgi:repressor LexA
MGLSVRQQEMLDFIKQFRRSQGYSPSIREIGQALNISSTSVVKYNLDVLEKEGHIHRGKDISRAMRVVGDPQDNAQGLIEVPLLGTIAAGEPIPVPAQDFSPYDYETVQLTQGITQGLENVYALRVKGNSMIDALIHDGDIVVMRHQQEANNGEMVAVWLRDEKETTLKRFYLEGNQVRLQPANPSMEPIYVHPANVEIQGKVIAVIRQVAA